MVFSSPIFLFAFLPLVVGIYFLVPKRARNIFLLVASLIFYIWGSGIMVMLLVVSTVVDYTAGIVINRGREIGQKTLARAGLVASILVNLSMLGYFKYANFFVDTINGTAEQFGIGPIAWTTVVLPIGISFFTFQSMSYSIDVYTGRATRMRNILDFALYVALFPQLVAGPIVRFHEIARELLVREPTWEKFNRGMQRFAWGLSKKVLIADTAAVAADAAFASAPGVLAPSGAWIGILAYTIQIYFDFSGYSDMAIGLGLVFGFDFPENFRRPYSSLSMTDFWRRWHITLSSWFRDYVYIPLGGSSGSSRRTTLNLWIVFLLTGLWHGAAWTFILWGAYHGALLTIERLTGQRRFDAAGWTDTVARRTVVILAVGAGWILFRSPSVPYAFDYLITLNPFAAGGITLDLTRTTILGILIGSAILFAPNRALGPRIGRFVNPRANTAFSIGLVMVVLPITLMRVMAGTFSPFIYFQF